MANIARVTTPWTGTGASNDAYRPKLTDDYPGIVSCVDVTGQPVANLAPNPNAYTVEIVVDDATLAAIQADSTYLVLYAEPQPTESV